MSREAVSTGLCSAGVGEDCGAVKGLGVVAARMTGGARAWAHAGILYRWNKQVWFFELQGHRQLNDEPVKNDPSRPSMVWVEPKLAQERVRLVANRCKLIFRKHQENKIPYGFRYSRTAFDEGGILRLGDGEVGLTCATIVDAVFAAEKIPLLDPEKWDPPDNEDRQSRRLLIAVIRKSDPERAAVLEGEIDAPRIRPEEVVAAAAIHPKIGTFVSLADGAAVVTERLGL